MTSAIELRDLTRSFGPRKAVDTLDLTVEPGDCYGFLGPNGAGKTTTLRLILDLARPDHGTIRIYGDSHPIRRRRHVGAVLEHGSFHKPLSGRKNLEVLAAYDEGVTAADIDAALEKVGLRERQNDKFGTYSLGMKQRLGIAQALMRKPKVLLLDEPTNGLDPAGIKSMRDLIARLRHEDGLTVMLSSHLLHEVEQLCNRVGIIHLGKLMKEGNKDDLLGNVGVEHYELSGAPREQLEPVVAALPGCTAVGLSPAGALKVRFDDGTPPSSLLAACEQAGLPRVELHAARHTLESLFMEVTGLTVGEQVG